MPAIPHFPARAHRARTMCSAWALLAALLAGCASPSAEIERRAGGAPSAETEKGVAEPLAVGVYMGEGSSGIGAMEWCRLVASSPEMTLTLLDGNAVRKGALDTLDLLVMPGGNSKSQYYSLASNGVELIKAFIRDGGGYIGTCAGCCLLMDEPVRRARVIPWKSSGSLDSVLLLSVAVNEAGAKALGIKSGTHSFRYHGGPFLQPTTNKIDGANFELWGTYDAEANGKGRVDKAKKMFGAGAIVGGTYGKGRVFATSVHPEYFDSTRYLVSAAFRWVTGREVTFPAKPRSRGALAVGFCGIGGVATARALLAIDAEDDIDLVPVDNDAIQKGALAHLDILVSANGAAVKSAACRGALAAFVARGGTVVACGAKDLAPIGGGILCKSPDALLPAIRRLFPKDGAKLCYN